MSSGQGGLDPRITGPVALAQSARRKPGIPLISDEEAERRQQQADASRRRRRIWRRVVVVLVAVVLVAWLFLTFGPIRL